MLDGHGKVEQYFAKAKDLGMVGLATTDHGNIHSWLDFYDAGVATGVKPILGSEFYQARKTRFDRDEEERSGPAKNEWEQRGPYHITILAKNNEGYHNIIKISSKSYLEGYYVKPRIDHELIAAHSSGLIVLSGCLNGEVAQALLRGDTKFALESAAKMQDIVGKENYFIEIQNHGLAEQLKITQGLIDIAQQIGAKVVPTGDCHYVHKEDARAHDIMLCVSTNSNINTENRFSFSGDNFYLKSYDEMALVFPEDWLKNTLEISSMVDVNLKFGDLHFPHFPLPEGTNTDDHLDLLAWDGLKKKYGDPLPEEVLHRAQHELRVVKEMGYPEYFLVVSDLVQWAKSNNIRVGWGRGSAAGSILSYALGITNLDPLKFGLMFERFLVEGRKSMPDIDLDFDDRHRDKVINYAREKYGDDKVAHICTFNKTGARQSIRDAARALAYDFIGGDKVAKLVPAPVLGVAKSLSECMETPEFRQMYDSDDDSKLIIDTAFGLEGLIRQTGMHAAGVVISREPLTDYLPIMKKGVDNPVITQWDMGRVEQCGLLKIDFLGLRNLGVIDECIKLVNKNRGILIDVDKIPLDDYKTYQELCKGNAIGVFQLESTGMRELMVQLQPQDVQDIMALISLYRPGPMGSGMDKLYISRKHSKSSIQYDHPNLEKVLGPSLGIMLYQEDVLGVARELAGFSTAEADDLRKVIGKKLMDKIALFRGEFVKGCMEKSDISEDKANKIYSDIEYFGGYGFNRAHAASYAMISYITAYLKANYTAEYMAALLSSVTGNKDKLALYLSDCRKLGIKVLSPSINKSVEEFTVIDEATIIFGLSAINGIGYAVSEAILSSRDQDKPYTSMHDFLRRTGPAVLKKSTIEHLANAGALDELISEVYDQDFGRQTELTILEKEKEELGIYVSKNPVDGVWDLLSKNIDYEIIEVADLQAGSRVNLGGIISSSKKMITKKGAKMYKFNLQDISSDIEVIVFPREAKKFDDDYFQNGDVVMLTGAVNKDGDEENLISKILLNSCEKLDLSNFSGGTPIYLEVDSNISAETLKKMYAIINATDGGSYVFLSYKENGKTLSFKFKKKTSISVKDKLNSLLSEKV
jgi:DNA polymerase III subunit alpha